PPGGESYAQVTVRIGGWYETVDKDTVVAAHGGTARALIAHLGLAAPEDATHYSIDQGVVYVFAGNPLARYAWRPPLMAASDRSMAAERLPTMTQAPFPAGPFDPGWHAGYHIAAEGTPCRSTPSAIFSGSRPSAKATGPRSVAWSTVAHPASR